MGAPKITEVEASFADWKFLAQLPDEINGFQKVPGKGREGQILYIVAYVNEAQHRRLDLTYTGETFDYVPVKSIGLHVFRDERYFCRDQERFGNLMLEHLPDILKELAQEHISTFDYEAKDVGFENWEFWQTLPQKIGNFELYITPDNPVNFINGSCIFLDYSDFEHQSTLYFLFNNFRVEVFGEMLQNNIPVTTNAFTVPEENEHGQRRTTEPNPKLILPRFTELLQEHLEEFLHKLGESGFETL